MRPLLSAIAVLLLLSAAHAKRRAPIPSLASTGVRTSFPKVRSWGEGFAAALVRPDGSKVVAWNAEGRDAKLLATAAADLKDWAAHFATGRVATLAAGEVNQVGPQPGDHRLLGRGDDGLAYAPDGSLLAWMHEGNVVLADAADGTKRVIAPREGRALVGPPVFTGDGKRLLVRSVPNPVKELARHGIVESADPTAAEPAFEKLHEVADADLSILAAAPSGGVVAWVTTAGAGHGSLRLFDTATGKFLEFETTGDFREVVFDTVGSRLLLVSADLEGKKEIVVQQFVRRREQGYPDDILAGSAEGEVRGVAAGGAITWFLRAGLRAGEFEVMRGEFE